MISKSVMGMLRDNILDFVAPEHCSICHKHIKPNTAQNKMICNSCINSIPYAPQPSIIKNRFYEYFADEFVGIDNAIALLSLKEDHRYLQPIHSFKYEGMSSLAYTFGILLGRRLQIEGFTNYDYIIPIPIHKVKSRERGYNQSFHIALGIHDYVLGELSDKFVKRTQYTITQTVLSKEQRKQNVGNIFVLRKNFSAAKSRILIIDDVLTTGSTINSLAKLLKDSGALQCDCATVAIA